MVPGTSVARSLFDGNTSLTGDPHGKMTQIHFRGAMITHMHYSAVETPGVLQASVQQNNVPTLSI